MLKALDNGLVHLASGRSVADTISALEGVLRRRGAHIKALIDHGADAAAVGLTMPPAQLLIFGNPAAGTPLMLAAPAVAIDLPLKALAWQDAEGAIWLTYNDPVYLQQRHGFAEELLKNIAGIASMCEEAVR